MTDIYDDMSSSQTAPAEDSLDGGYTDPEWGGSFGGDESDAFIGPSLDGGYSQESAEDQSEWSPQPGTAEMQPGGGSSPDGTYTLPEITIVGEPQADPAPDFRLPGICTPDGDVTYSDPEYDGPSIEPLSHEDYEKGVEQAKEWKEFFDEFFKTPEWDEGPPEAPEFRPPPEPPAPITPFG